MERFPDVTEVFLYLSKHPYTLSDETLTVLERFVILMYRAVGYVMQLYWKWMRRKRAVHQAGHCLNQPTLKTLSCLVLQTGGGSWWMSHGDPCWQPYPRLPSHISSQSVKGFTNVLKQMLCVYPIDQFTWFWIIGSLGFDLRLFTTCWQKY